MKTYRIVPLLALFAIAMFALGVTEIARAQSGAAPAATPAEMLVANAPIPVRILVQSPADTVTELQIICLFRSDRSNTLHGSLIETNAKLKGLLDEIRKPSLFRGELGETLLIEPPEGSLAAKKLMIIGLGGSETFTPERMELVGSIVYREASRLGVAHPFFAPTILDGGVSKYTTGQISKQVVAGFLRAAHTEKVTNDAGASPRQVIKDLTYLAGSQHASATRQGIEEAIAADASR